MSGVGYVSRKGYAKDLYKNIEYKHCELYKLKVEMNEVVK
jgi:hypothetical protein